MQSLGWSCIEVDIDPLLEAAQLLYEGPWVAERYAAVGEFMEAHEGALLPVTRGIVARGEKLHAVDAFRAMYRLKSLQRASESLWEQIEYLRGELDARWFDPVTQRTPLDAAVGGFLGS